MLEGKFTQTATKLSTYRDASGDLMQRNSGQQTYSCMFRSITPFMQTNHMENQGFQGLVWFPTGTPVAVGDAWIMPDGLYYRVSSVTLAQRTLESAGTTEFIKCQLTSMKTLVS